MSQTVHRVASLAPVENGIASEDRRNVLVHLAGTGTDERLVREAGAHARSTGGTLVLLSVMSAREFAARNEARRRAGLERCTYAQAEDERQRVAARTGQAVWSALAVESIAVGAIGREAEQVLATAHDHECGHVFLVDRKRTGRDRLARENGVRTVTGGFDGLVTVLRETISS